MFVFERQRPLRDDMLVVKVLGVETRGAASALTGTEIFARRDRLPEPSEDEFYYDDLVGLVASTRDGRPIGRVAAISNYGAGDILEIAPEGGGEPLLLPFTKAVAPTVDFAGANRGRASGGDRGGPLSGIANRVSRPPSRSNSVARRSMVSV